MNEKELKKLIALQDRANKMRDRIVAEARKYNKLVLEELRPLSEGVMHNTLYEVEGDTYRRGRLFCQLSCGDDGLSPKAEGLHLVRRAEKEAKDAHPDSAEG